VLFDLRCFEFWERRVLRHSFVEQNGGRRGVGAAMWARHRGLERQEKCGCGGRCVVFAELRLW
jgi:hypothetical protein